MMPGVKRAAVFGALWTCGWASVGCAPNATFHVTQPHLSGPQRELNLTTMDAMYGTGRMPRSWDVVLRFPLPGASTGGSRYIVYLHMPEPTGRKSIEYALGDNAAARGFFLQTGGEGHGRELIRGGSVQATRGLSGKWSIRLAARCELDTHIEGTASLRRNDYAVREFLDARHAGDVKDAIGEPTASQPHAYPQTPKAGR